MRDWLNTSRGDSKKQELDEYNLENVVSYFMKKSFSLNERIYLSYVRLVMLLGCET